MSAWQAIEDVMVQTLQGLEKDQLPLLATVKGYSWRDRRVVLASLQRERLPCAYIVVGGREAGEKARRRPGALNMSVYLAAGSLRGDTDARLGSNDVTGAFEIWETVAAALQDLEIGNDRLLLVDERPAGGEESLIVWEQRYEIRSPSATSLPTFGGGVLAGAESDVQVIVGHWKQATSTFAFPGIDGVFQRDLGMRDRVITWTGQLRAEDDEALDTIEAGIEAAVGAGEVKTVTDAHGRSYDDCVVKAFERKGTRRRDGLSGAACQDFELTFTQLNP